jgi:hypothetical protein
MQRANDPDAKFETVIFDVATGAKVRTMIDEFWEQLSDDDLRHGHRPKLYYAIRVYSDEGTNPKRLVSHTEFRAGNDFDQSCIPRLWTWLVDLSVSRHRFSYDCVEEFLEEFSARMDEFTAAAEDAADYLHKAHGIQPAYEDPPHAEFSEDRLPSGPRDSVAKTASSLEDKLQIAGEEDDGAIEVQTEREFGDDPEEH